MSNYQLVIGIEIHAELNTNSKLFCNCRNQFGAEPNTLVCPVCMGLPGTLPIINRQAFLDAIKVGLLFDCEMTDVAIFERKNYFYPDLPKSYQISQFNAPICRGGGITLDSGKFIRFNRIHLEEDSGKLVHDYESNRTLVDFNRCGIPLVEMVTEPEFHTSEEVVEFIDKLRKALVFEGVSHCRMQEGGMRFDVNMSVSRLGSKKLGTRVELKNLNSFKAVSLAIESEKNRQIAIFESGGVVAQETRGWNEESGETYLMRVKESSIDYRYFPDPDIPQVKITKTLINKLRKQMKESYSDKKHRFIHYGLSENDCQILLSDLLIAEYYDGVVKLTNQPKECANWIISEVLHYFRDGYNNPYNIISCENLAEIINLLTMNKLTRTSAKVLFASVVETGKTTKSCLKELGLNNSVDFADVVAIIETEINNRFTIVDDYIANPNDIENYIIGIVNNQTNGRVSIEDIKSLLREVIDKSLL